MALPTTLRLGAWVPLTDTFVAHSSCPTGAILDLNDGVTFSLVDDGSGLGTALAWGLPVPTIYDSGNPRTVGRKVTRRAYEQNREVHARLFWGQGTSYATWIAAIHTLDQTLEGISETQPAALMFQATGSSTTLYYEVRAAYLVTDYKETLYSQLVDDGIEIVFVCKPFLRGNKQVLANALVNPGFNAYGGPPTQVFNDTFSSLNAYTVQSWTNLVPTDTPLGWWRLAEVTGTSAADSSGNSHTGTYTGTVTLNQAAFNADPNSSSVTFDGSTGYVTIPFASALNPATWSAVAWIYVTDITSLRCYLSTRGSNQGFLLGVNTSGELQCTIGNGSAYSTFVTGASTIATNTWYMVSVTYDGTNVRLYINGSFSTSGGFTGYAAQASGAMNIGRDALAVDYWKGNLEDVAVFGGTVLSAGQITALYTAGATLGQDTTRFPDTLNAGASTSLLRYYRLDEASGTVGYDGSTNLQNGTYVGTPTFGTTSLLTGDTDTAVTLNGTTQYMTIPTTGLPTGNASWSIGLLFRISANPTTNSRTLIFMGTNTAKEWARIQITTSGTIIGDVSGTATAASGAVSLNATHLAVLTWNGTTLSLFVDNNAALTATPGNLSLTMGSAAVGADNGGGSYANFFPGIVDEAFIVGLRLTATQVGNLWTTATTTPVAQANTMLVPASGQVTFGSSAWHDLNLWQIRFRYNGPTAGSTASVTFYLHYVDANDGLYVTVAGNSLTIFQNIAATVTNLATSSAPTLVNGQWYWLQVRQFPDFQTYAYVQATLFADNGGTVGTQIAAIGPVSQTPFTSTILAGRPAIVSSGSAPQTIGIGGNYTNVNWVNLFGPGGWFLNPQFGGSGATAFASGAWDLAAFFPNGPTASYASARIDLPPGGTVAAYWDVYNSGAFLGSNAVFVQTAGNTLAAYGWVKSTGLSSSATIVVHIAEFNSGGSLLRQGDVATLTGNQASWVQLGGAYTTGANCYAVDVQFRVIDTSAARASANGTVWIDNVQCWDVTRTGMATMPYCELNFGQTPAQLLVTGILGDVPAPCVMQMATYFPNSWSANKTASIWLGRRRYTSPGARLTQNSTGGTPTASSTAYWGYTVLANLGLLSTTGNDESGIYEVLGRAETANSNPAQSGNGVYIYTDVSETQGNVFGATIGHLQGTNVYPFSSQNVWTICDLGAITLPPFPHGALVDTTQVFANISTVSGGTGGSQLTVNWIALLPLDGERFLATLNNPTSGSTFSNYLWVYWDGVGGATTISTETVLVPNPNHSGGSYGSLTSPTINVNPVADLTPFLDPTQTTPNAAASGSGGVNQFVYISTDQGANVTSGAVEIIYWPRYRMPE